MFSLTSPLFARVHDSVTAKANDETNDGDDDDANGDRDAARVDGREDLAGQDRVDGAETDKGDQVEQGGQDCSEEAVRVASDAHLPHAEPWTPHCKVCRQAATEHVEEEDDECRVSQ